MTRSRAGRVGEITSETRLRDAAGLWLAGLREEGRASTTLDAYDDAALVAERIRALVRAAGIPHAGSPDGAKLLTVSLGVASVRPAVEQVRVDHLIALADQALCRAKATGRDRVAVASHCEPLGNDRTVPTTWTSQT